MDQQPDLLIEPGSALVGDAMKFVAPVVSIKDIRGKAIATLLGSVYNINPTLNKKNPPITVYSEKSKERQVYHRFRRFHLHRGRLSVQRIRRAFSCGRLSGF